MTQIERLLARIKNLCKENPSCLIGVKIITDSNGEPFLWFPDQPVNVEGNDSQLISAGLKGTTRKLAMP